jgi:hypothetical protein
MRRLALALSFLMWTAALAGAQPTLSVPSIVVNTGGTVAATVTGGTAGHSYAIIGSTSNTGFSYAGVALSVGTDVAILAIGVLDGAGNSAAHTIAPPFPARDRYYIQAVTSPNNFASITPTAGITLINGQEARIYLSVGGGVNGANGVGFALSPGTTTTRTGPGAYTVTWGNQFNGPNVIPTITPACGQSPTGVTANNGGFTVTFASDCTFFFTGTPIRR